MRIYNSLTKMKELFAPFNDKKVTMYVCGITPYDTTHLGHASTYIFFDVLYRYLTFRGYSVIYTQNVTDIDDDILKRARKTKTDWKKLGNYWTERFLLDMKALNVLPSTYYVKATESIDKMIQIILSLTKKGFSYQRDENVYFEVKKFKSYGKLSRFNKSEMIKLSKERGADPDDPRKIDPLDFILWQCSREDEPFWESPWGAGRPGWHIECSAMVHQFLGEQIDIHGGGHDLIYPHHESEIAQSESFTDKTPFAKYWIHTGMLYYKGQKMAKSKGNLVMVLDLLKKYTSNATRWMILSHHYQESWEFKESELVLAEKAVLNAINRTAEKSPEDFFEAMDDDLNTPLALSVADKKCLKILGFSC